MDRPVETLQELGIEGIWIPKSILDDSTLPHNEKFYLSVYLQFDKNIGYSEYILSFTMSDSTIRRCRKSLLKKGLISITNSPEEIKNTTLKLLQFGDKCEWCGQRSFVLHKHHFPIPRHKGGIDTVSICPNCHCTYHKLMKDYEEKSNFETN